MSKAAEAIVRECEVEDWLTVEVVEKTVESYRQERRGRPGRTRGTGSRNGRTFRADAPRGAGAIGRGVAVRWGVSAGEQRREPDGAASCYWRTSSSRRWSDATSN